MFNKKGEGEWMTIFGIVIAVALIAIVGYFLYTGSTKADNIFQKFPTETSLIISACKGAITLGTELAQIDFCTNTRRITDNTYVTCADKRISEAVSVTTAINIKCVDQFRSLFVIECEKLKPSSTNKLKINNKDVDSLGKCADAYEPYTPKAA